MNTIILKKICRSLCFGIAITIATEFYSTSFAEAFSLDWGRADVIWNDNDLTNTYEFDPLYTSQFGALFVRLTVSTNPTDDGGNPVDVYAVSSQRFGITPGIYPGTEPTAGTGLFTDELFVFTNRNSPTPDTISLTIEFFEDASGTIPTNVEDFNTTFTDLDAGLNGIRQEIITFTGEDTSSNSISPAFTIPTNSVVSVNNNVVTGNNVGIEDDSGNVNVKFVGDVHKINIDFLAALEGNKNRKMYMYDLGITPTDIAVTPIPFEFSPGLGLVIMMGFLGINYLWRKIKYKNINLEEK